MATKQNGVLGSFTPTVTPYTHDTRPDNSLAVAANEFPFYTCPGATMVSAKLIISNNIDAKGLRLAKKQSIVNF